MESKESSRGLLYMYEYDDIGRLSGIIMPTGEKTTITTDSDVDGVQVTIQDDGIDNLALAINSNTLRIKSGYIFNYYTLRNFLPNLATLTVLNL